MQEESVKMNQGPFLDPAWSRVTALVLKGSIRVLYYRGHIGFL